MKDNYTVFTWPYSKRYYLTHPWKWFSGLWTNLCNAWSRATKGYCWTDVCDIDIWFLYVFPSMLQDFARNAHTYPGSKEFPTYESWTNWLEDIAAKLISCREEEQDKRNEFYEEYIASFDDEYITEKNTELGTMVTWYNKPEHDKIAPLYYARAQEIREEVEATLDEVFHEVRKNFWSLWD